MSFFIKLNCKKKNGILKSVTFLKSPLFFQPDGALNLLTELFLIDKKKSLLAMYHFVEIIVNLSSELNK